MTELGRDERETEMLLENDPENQFEEGEHDELEELDRLEEDPEADGV
jgi:hypothetical protein